MKKLTLIALFVVFILVTTACSQAPTEVPPAPQGTDVPTEISTPEPTEEATDVPLETFHVKVGYLPYLSEAPYFLAQDLGFFEEQGLEVELIRFAKVEDMMPALASGELDVSNAFPNPALINSIARGAAVKVVSGKGYLDPDTCDASGFVARKDLLESGVLDDPNNWKGLTFVATAVGDVADYLFDSLLTQNGLTMDDVVVMQLPVANRVDALQTGAIDITMSGEPLIVRVKNADVGDLWMPYSEINPNAAYGMIAFGPTLLEQHPDVGQRFMIAFLKGIAAYSEGKNEANVAALAKYTELSVEEITQACWIPMKTDGSINLDFLMEYQAWAVEKGYITEPVTIDELWDPQFIEYANEHLK